MNVYRITYRITSLMTNQTMCVGEVNVRAATEEAARASIAPWVEANDPHYDRRIDPLVTIISVTDPDPWSDPDWDWEVEAK